MHKSTIICLLLLATSGLGHKTFAQDQPGASQPKAQEAAPAEHFYHLDFVVEELNAEGKVVNSRNFSTTITTRERAIASIRAQSRLPIPMASNNIQYQDEDIGTNFDVRNVHEVRGQLALELTANVSSVARTINDQNSMVIRQNKWEAVVLIPVGKQTVVFSSDSVDSKGSTRVLVTATAIQ